MIDDLQKNNFEIRNKNKLIQFQPEYILNIVRDDSDYPSVLAINIALKELFGLELHHIGTIFYNYQMRNHLRMYSLKGIINNSNDANTCYQALINKLINRSDTNNPLNTPMGIKKLIHDETCLDKKEGYLICSSNCGLWGSCSYQHGGHPCKIKYVGFLNTN